MCAECWTSQGAATAAVSGRRLGRFSLRNGNQQPLVRPFNHPERRRRRFCEWLTILQFTIVLDCSWAARFVPFAKFYHNNYTSTGSGSPIPPSVQHCDYGVPGPIAIIVQPLNNLLFFCLDLSLSFPPPPTLVGPTASRMELESDPLFG